MTKRRLSPCPSARATNRGSTRPRRGKNLDLAYINRDPKGFLDALAFWDPGHGIAMGDPVNGRYLILNTDDGGNTWRPIPAEGMPRPGRAKVPSPPAGHAWPSSEMAMPGSAPAGRSRHASSARRTEAGPGRPTRRPSGRARRPRGSSRWHSATATTAWLSGVTTRIRVARAISSPSRRTGAGPGGGRRAESRRIPVRRRLCSRHPGKKHSWRSVRRGAASPRWRRALESARDDGFNAVRFAEPGIGWAARRGRHRPIRGRWPGEIATPYRSCRISASEDPSTPTASLGSSRRPPGPQLRAGPVEASGRAPRSRSTRRRAAAPRPLQADAELTLEPRSEVQRV